MFHYLQQGTMNQLEILAKKVHIRVIIKYH